jgi:hypothetical protein
MTEARSTGRSFLVKPTAIGKIQDCTTPARFCAILNFRIAAVLGANTKHVERTGHERNFEGPSDQEGTCSGVSEAALIERERESDRRRAGDLLG